MKETDKKKLVKLLAVGGAGVIAYTVLAPSGGAMFSGSGAGGLGLPSTGDGGGGAEESGGAAVFNIPSMPSFEGFGADTEESITDVLPSPTSMAAPVVKKDDAFVFGGASSLRSSSPTASFGGSWDEPDKPDKGGLVQGVADFAYNVSGLRLIEEGSRSVYKDVFGMKEKTAKAAVPKKIASQGTKDSFKSFATGGFFAPPTARTSSGGVPSTYAMHEYLKKRQKGRAKSAADSASDRASGTGAWSGFSRMTGENKVAGWKQVGAKKPTRAGQPDRY